MEEPLEQTSLDDSYGEIYRTVRPDSKLLAYLCIRALLFGPLAPVLLVINLIFYFTLRYQFTEEGVKQSWGRLWRREIFLTYARIQDIHVTRDLFERWMGLATISIQTASGSSTPEMVIRGMPQFSLLRDFLYERMRGLETSKGAAPGGDEPLNALLADILTEIRGIRAQFERGRK